MPCRTYSTGEMIYVFYQNRGFIEEVKYIFDLLFSYYGVSYIVSDISESKKYIASRSDIVITYSEAAPCQYYRNHIHIYLSQIFWGRYLKSESIPSDKIRWYKGVPVLYQGAGRLNNFVKCNHKPGTTLVETNIDLIAASFYMITEYESYLCPDLDQHGRFPASASLAYREKFLQVPVVNQYIELLWSWIESFCIGIQRRRLWGNHKFAAAVTYDIDSPRKYRKHTCKELAWLALRDKDTDLRGVMERVKSRYIRDPYNTYSYIFKTHERYGIPPTFYLQAGGASKYDNPYELDSPEIEKIRIRTRSWGEIGFHGSYDSYKDLDALLAERAKLEEYLQLKVTGIRQHYLRWQTPLTWRLQAQAGFKYDSTLLYADQFGFRAGICLPFRPFDVEKREVIDIWEIPPTVMDGNLFTYMGLSPEKGLLGVIDLIEQVKEVGGLFVLIWHNSSFDSEAYPGWRKTHAGILEYLAKADPLFVTPSTISNSLLKIVD